MFHCMCLSEAMSNRCMLSKASYHRHKNRQLEKQGMGNGTETEMGMENGNGKWEFAQKRRDDCSKIFLH